ncbi:MAG: methyltransferase [Desulfamplus sp.]|nr:methyltransferase [Desulfamplus sp.]
MTSNELNPGRLLGISGAYWQTCTLHAAVKLDIFSAVGESPVSIREIAEKIDAPQRSLSMLLDALCAMELLEKNIEADSLIYYKNSSISSKFLCRDSPEYIGFMIMHHYHLVESWHRLDESVLGGKPVRPRASFTDEEKRESFLMGMFNIAMASAPGIVPAVDLSNKKMLLDLGGGPGTYAIQFCLHNPHLSAAVFDLPTSRPFAEKTIARFNLQDRITFQAGNFLENDIEGSFDAVWISHILHGDSPEDCRKIIDRAASVMMPGGMIIIHDFILNNEKDSPLFPALFSLNMLLATEGGQAYSEKEIMDMLEKAGFINLGRSSYVGPTESGIITGYLPA